MAIPLPGSDIETPNADFWKRRSGPRNTGVPVSWAMAGAASTISDTAASRLRRMNDLLRMFGNDADDIPHDLQEPAADGERPLPAGDPHQQGTLAEERHEWGVVRQDADLAIVGRHLEAFGLPVKDGAVRAKSP